MFRHMHRHGLKVFLGVLGLFAVFSLLVMLLWNAVMPDLMGAGNMSYLQAAGLLALCRVLFGGLGLGGLMGTMAIKGKGLREAFRTMNPEQRDAFARRMGEHFSGHAGFFRHMCEHVADHAGHEARHGHDKKNGDDDERRG